MNSITVVCRNKEPVEVPMEGVGTLSLISGCKAYNKLVIMQTHSFTPIRMTSY